MTARTPPEEAGPGGVARSLCRRLARIADQEQRARALGRSLAEHEPERIAAVLAAVIELADRREPGADLLLRALVSPGLRVTWESGLALQVMVHARQDGSYDLASMFLDLPPTDERLEVPPPPLPREMAKVPLGMRRSLARRGDIGLLERLLGDPDEAVVANLLNNPRMTEVEVVRMASRTPVRETVLRAVAAHPRWNGKYRVQLTLAHNPSTPTGITLGLLHLLMAQDLREICRDARLSRVVLARAGAILREREGAGREERG